MRVILICKRFAAANGLQRRAGQLQACALKSGLLGSGFNASLCRQWRTRMSASDRSNYSRRVVLKSGVLATLGLGIGGRLFAADKPLPLITKAIPSTKEKLPVVGIGTNAFGVSDTAELAARADVLKTLPELGGSVVDTAQAYGTSE